MYGITNMRNYIRIRNDVSHGETNIKYLGIRIKIAEGEQMNMIILRVTELSLPLAHQP